MLQTNQALQVIQWKSCKAFDQHYGNRRKLGNFQANATCMNNQFNANSNVDGFVNFGISINGIIAQTTLKFLPQFIKIQDCSYPDSRGYDQFNKVVCEGTQFKWDETFTFNNLESILSLLCYKHKNVFVLGKTDKIDFDIIFDHSQSQIVAHQKNADLVIFFQHSQQLIQSVEQKSPKSVKLFILSSKSELHKFDMKKNNYAFAYEFALKQGLNLAALHTKEPKIKKNVEEEWFFCSTSTVTRRASLVPDLKIQIGQTGTEAVRKMIEIDSKVIVPQENIWFTMGVATGIDTISRALFKNVKLGVDAPYYFGFNTYFTHHKAKIVSRPILPGSRMVDRIKQSERQGCVGYIICNPRNPVGTILQPQEVDEICVYVRDKPNFHLVFDEAFVNACFVTETKSAVSYAVQLPNVHVARGLGKDFGTYGFKVGFTISSNPLVMKKFKEWKPMISHHPYTISVASALIKKSNYGKEIFEIGKQIIRDNFEIVCSELDKQKISYEKPVAGCFLYLNLKEFMRQQTLDEEYVLWKKLFYKYRVNVHNGAYFHTPQFGYFRICPIFNKQIMKEGLRRLIAGLKDKTEY